MRFIEFRLTVCPGQRSGRPEHQTVNSPTYSGSFGLLKSPLSLMLPCPNCGKLKALRFPGSSVEAVSSGGKITSELRNAMTRDCCSDDMFTKALRAACASPP